MKVDKLLIIKYREGNFYLFYLKKNLVKIITDERKLPSLSVKQDVFAYKNCYIILQINKTFSTIH